MKASEQFKKGNNNIGYVDGTFSKHFGDQEFDQKAMPIFQKLPRSMNDAAIESELKHGLCELGDILAFIRNSPQECKDGYSNLFYFSAFVVFVSWGYSEWSVRAGPRGGREWSDGDRVFSPETVSSATSIPGPKSLGHSEKSEDEVNISLDGERLKFSGTVGLKAAIEILGLLSADDKLKK